MFCQLEKKKLDELFIQNFESDPLWARLLNQLRQKKRQNKDFSLFECKKIDGKLYYQNRMYISDFHKLDMRFCKNFHDSPIARHSDRTKRFDLFQKKNWPRHHEFVAKYVQKCYVCSCSKPNQHQKHGLFYSLPVLTQHWKNISMESIVNLLDPKSNDSICVVIDRLSKTRHHFACHITLKKKT